MRLIRWLLLPILLVMTHAAAAADQKVFNVKGVPFYLDLHFAAAAAGDETLSRGVYLFHLKCSADISCGFERVTLNECSRPEGGGETQSSPRVDHWSTFGSEMLAVRQLSDNQVELTVYQGFGHTLPAKVLLTLAGEPPFSRLAGFKTTGFVDGRFWPRLDVGIEYVPLPKDRTKSLDCPVSLVGLNP
jgi:hypothetical protein